MQLGQLGSPPATLSGDDFIGVGGLGMPPYQDRLQDTLGLDRLDKRGERRLVEVLPRLEAPGIDLVGGDVLGLAQLVEVGIVLRLLAEELAQAAAEAAPAAG